MPNGTTMNCIACVIFEPPVKIRCPQSKPLRVLQFLFASLVPTAPRYKRIINNLNPTMGMGLPADQSAAKFHESGIPIGRPSDEVDNRVDPHPSTDFSKRRSNTCASTGTTPILFVAAESLRANLKSHLFSFAIAQPSTSHVSVRRTAFAPGCLPRSLSE